MIEMRVGVGFDVDVDVVVDGWALVLSLSVGWKHR